MVIILIVEIFNYDIIAKYDNMIASLPWNLGLYVYMLGHMHKPNKSFIEIPIMIYGLITGCLNMFLLVFSN